MRTNQYVIKSLELHLFFGRIMKEHALFLRAGFTPANPDFSAKAELYQKEFASVLDTTVTLSQNIVSEELLRSGEIVTEFTCPAEKQTQYLTGIPIDSCITERTLQLACGSRQNCISQDLFRQVSRLNRTALKLLDELICFKETILKKVLQCEMFTGNYPLLIEHIIREAKLYRKYLETLEREGDITVRSMRDTTCFWNQIMMEHAQFIRGLLDPCEEELIETADDFADIYCDLLEASRNAHCQTMTEKALEETIRFRDFKAAGTEGIQNCSIRSVILPLLADHVLREANHYIRLLNH